MPRGRRPSRTAIGALFAAVASLGAAVAAVAWFFGGRGALPRAARSSVADAVAENRRCEGCHEDVAEEWRDSQHRTAFTDPTFQAALAIEPKAFCRGCHAPEDPEASVEGGAHTLGVGCVTCHRAGDVVLAAPGERWPRASHRVDRDADFATAAACAGCHEFSFDDDARREHPQLMQRTVSEHRASPDAAKSCADCHMPRASDGHRSHAFASTRDPEAHRRAVQVTAERASGTSVRLRIVTEGVGHAYPTGDLFRRVAVEAEVEGEEHRVLASARRYLGRHYTTGRDVHDEPIRVEASDDRLEPGVPTVVELELGEHASGRAVRWTVTLDRVLHVADHREAAAVVPDRVLLASGEVPP